MGDAHARITRPDRAKKKGAATSLPRQELGLGLRRHQLARPGELFAEVGVPDAQAVPWVDRFAGRPAGAALEHTVLWRRSGTAD